MLSIPIAHSQSPPVLLGTEPYERSFGKEQHGLCRSWGNQTANGATNCQNCSVTVEHNRCHTLLFHGKLDRDCLSQRNLEVENLPCVRSLLITSFMGSGTASIADAIQAVHEDPRKESDKLVGWLSRTDVWQLSNDFRGGPTHNRTYEAKTIATIHGGRSWGLTAKATLSRCLYRRVLLQTREPLATIHSALALFCKQAGYFVMADQLLVRSLSQVISQHPCGPPIAPLAAGFCTHYSLRYRDRRAPLMAYLIRLWYMWMHTAANMADEVYAIEHTNQSQICAQGNVTCPKQDRLSNHRNHHTGYDHIFAVTWEELQQADRVAAALAYRLSTSRFGYVYSGADAALFEGST